MKPLEEMPWWARLLIGVLIIVIITVMMALAYRVEG
jgi:hypothetical protein